jgi:transcriptional regulator with XRE-family HTH domain
MKTARLEEIRVELKINKTQFAGLMGISPHYYYQILNGQGSTNLRLEHLENLLTTKGVNPAWVITGEGEKFLNLEVAPIATDDNTTKEPVPLDKKTLMADIMRYCDIPAIPGDMSYAMLDNLVQKSLDSKSDFISNRNHVIESLSLAWISMLELAQQMIGQGFEFEYDHKKYAFRPL